MSTPLSVDPVLLGLPHREPFIFVDEVLSVEAGQQALARKTFRPEEPYFRGHFPGDPLVPGVLLAEAMAQTAGIAAGQPGKRFYLSAIRGMKFLAPVRPGAVVELRARQTAVMGPLWMFDTAAVLDGEIVAEGSIVLREIAVDGAG